MCIRDSIYAIAQALHRLAVELGVEVRTSCPVRRIEVANGRVAGVVTCDGALLAADQVIANVDVATVYATLLPPTLAPARVARLNQLETSCSGFVLLLGVEGEHPHLAHHNIFFNRDYRREFADIFRRGVPPADPTVYVAITSKRDPSHAPPGCENWFVLINAPPLGPRFDWAQQAARYREVVFDTLSRYGLDVRPRIRSEVMLTPEHIRHLTGAWRGALYLSLIHISEPTRPY